VEEFCLAPLIKMFLTTFTSHIISNLKIK